MDMVTVKYNVGMVIVRDNMGMVIWKDVGMVMVENIVYGNDLTFCACGDGRR